MKISETNDNKNIIYSGNIFGGSLQNTVLEKTIFTKYFIFSKSQPR